MMNEKKIAGPHPLLVKAIPAAEALLRAENFSIENLCRAVDCPLKELAGAIGSVDELFLHVNDRFMSAYIEKAAKLQAETKDDLEAVSLLCAGWLDHALANPQSMNVLLQHKWADGFLRPDWYFARVAACFAPMEQRLVQLAPNAPLEAVAGVARGLYAHICGLYF